MEGCLNEENKLEIQHGKLLEAREEKRTGDERGCAKSFERSKYSKREEFENRKSSESWQEITFR
jgi:hypothetical protein